MATRILTADSKFTEARLRRGVVAEAQRNLGHDYRDSAVPYNWPPEQFDCSTYVRWCWTKFGIDPDAAARYLGTWPQPKPSKAKWRKYPGYTMTQLAAGRRLGAEISFHDVQPGDALYYANADGRPEYHVTIYIGDRQVDHAAGTPYGVIRSSVVGPGQIGHGGKKLVGVISLAKVADALGILVPPRHTTVTLTRAARVWGTPYDRASRHGRRAKGARALVVEARRWRNRVGHKVLWLQLANGRWIKASRTNWRG